MLCYMCIKLQELSTQGSNSFHRTSAGVFFGLAHIFLLLLLSHNKRIAKAIHGTPYRRRVGQNDSREMLKCVGQEIEVSLISVKHQPSLHSVAGLLTIDIYFAISHSLAPFPNCSCVVLFWSFRMNRVRVGGGGRRWYRFFNVHVMCVWMCILRIMPNYTHFIQFTEISHFIFPSVECKKRHMEKNFSFDVFFLSILRFPFNPFLPARPRRTRGSLQRAYTVEGKFISVRSEKGKLFFLSLFLLFMENKK